MYIYLNTPRVFWQIPGTDIRLTRSQPIIEITDEEFESMTQDQQDVINNGFATKVLTKVNKSFVPSASAGNAAGILKLPVQEIQRRHVAHMILNRNVKGVQELLEAERSASKSRPEVIKVLESARDMILSDHPEEKYYNAIEEAVENIEGVIVEESVPVENVQKKLPTRRKRQATKSRTAKTKTTKTRAKKTGVTEK